MLWAIMPTFLPDIDARGSPTRSVPLADRGSGARSLFVQKGTSVLYIWLPSGANSLKCSWLLLASLPAGAAPFGPRCRPGRPVRGARGRLAPADKPVEPGRLRASRVDSARDASARDRGRSRGCTRTSVRQLRPPDGGRRHPYLTVSKIGSTLFACRSTTRDEVRQGPYRSPRTRGRGRRNADGTYTVIVVDRDRAICSTLRRPTR